MSAASPPVLLMKRDEIITLKRAISHSGKSADTIRRWCKRYGIARQSGTNAPLEISAIALEMVLHADLDALEILRQGRRGDPAVRRYIDHLGLPD